MKKLISIVILIAILAIPVKAEPFIAPTVPESGESWMPRETENFGKGLWELVCSGIRLLQPSLTEAAGLCFSLLGVCLLSGVVQSFAPGSGQTVNLVTSVFIGVLIFENSNSMIQLGSETVRQLSDYGKLLLPVMTAALAAQGGATTSAALYTATAFFDAVLSSLVYNAVIPMVYVYLCLCIVTGAVELDLLKKLRSSVKWLMVWSLKVVLYGFTGYLGLTGVVSGSTDASILKATKLTISGMVPVVGGILSDASDAVLAGAAVMKNMAGIYGLLAVLAVAIGPFIQIGVQYLLLKATAAVCSVCAPKQTVGLIQDFSGAMGMLLAMTGTVCLLLLISTVCFMRGAG